MPQKRDPLSWFHYADSKILTVGILLLLLFLFADLQRSLSSIGNASPILRVVLFLLISLILYMGALLRAQRTGSQKALSVVIWLCFCLYLYLLLSLTLFDPSLRLTQDRFSESDLNKRAYYLQYFVNLRPFESIYTVYIRGLIKGYVSLRYTVLNLLGNLCAFMPLALFLPWVFPKTKRWYWFVPVIILSVAAVEGLQYLLMVGSCDVDDLLLNAGGAIALFFLLRIPPLSRLCEQIPKGFFKNKN